MQNTWTLLGSRLEPTCSPWSALRCTYPNLRSMPLQLPFRVLRLLLSCALYTIWFLPASYALPPLAAPVNLPLHPLGFSFQAVMSVHNALQLPPCGTQVGFALGQSWVWQARLHVGYVMMRCASQPARAR